MILPAILYGLDADTQSLLLSVLSRISHKTETPFRVQLCTDDLDEAVLEIRSEKNIMLMVMGVDSIRKDRDLLALRLGRLAMKLNRDHYVVYIVKEPQELSQLLPLCARCSGVLVCPPQEKAIEHVFTPLFEDYHRVYAREASDDGQWINVKTEGKVYRLRLSDVCMVQAVNKTIEFHTLKQTVSTYGSMDGVEKMLGDSFIRCHRSYFVNKDCIQFIDFREMNIHLMDGSVVPLARSFKECMQRSFAIGKA